MSGLGAKVNINNNLCHFCISSPDNTVACADSGCTSHFLRNDAPCDNKIPTTNGIRVGIPDGTSMRSSHTANLNLDHIPLVFPPAALRATVFPALKQQSLLSLGQFCDNGFITILTKTNAYLIKHDNSIIKDATTIGVRNSTNGLWDVNLTQNPTKIANFAQEQVCNSAYHMTTIKDLIMYLHRACFSPTIST